MKKDTKARKLTISRETVLPLQNDQLVDVAGGSTPASVITLISAATVAACPFVSMAFNCFGR